MTPLEIGSDIGGSIRVPGAYCGVYGHRPSETAIPREGSFPHAPICRTRPALMGVQGPLARSATDLELLFDVIAGPCIGEDAGWKLALPEARDAQLKDFRVAVMPRDAVGESRVRDAGQGRIELAQFLSQRGAKVAQAMPNVDFEQYFRDYLCLLTVMTSQGADARRARSAAAAAPSGLERAGRASGRPRSSMRPAISRWCAGANRRAPRGARSSTIGTC